MTGLNNGKIEIDEITLAYLQINHSIMACDFSDFHKVVESVLERPVYTHQFATENEKIREEINQKFKEFCESKNTDHSECPRGDKS